MSHNNIHIDGNNNLGLPGSIPPSISQWKHLNTIFWGIGSNLSPEEFDIPIDFTGWEHLFAANRTASANFPSGWSPNITYCSVLPNLASWNVMEQTDPEFGILLGFLNSDWDSQTCIDYWNETQVEIDCDKIPHLGCSPGQVWGLYEGICQCYDAFINIPSERTKPIISNGNEPDIFKVLRILDEYGRRK